MDQISLDRIKLLHPKLRDEAVKILTEIDQKVNTKTSFCRITFGLRTFAEQQAIYNQGRTTPGPIVSNAKAGYSFHNYGLAVDIAFVVNGKGSWDTKKDWNKNGKSDWIEVVDIFKSHGWEWGDRGYVDLPHFQKVFGYKPSDLLAKYNKKDFIKGTTYVNI